MDRSGVLLLLLVLLIPVNLAKSSDLSLFRDFLNFEHVKSGVYLHCMNEKIDLSNSVANAFPNNDLRISFLELKSVENFNFSNIFHTVDKYKLGVYLDLECSNARKILQEASTLTKFRQIHYWLLITSNFQNAEKVFADIQLNVDSEVNVALKTNNSIVEFFEIYSTCYLCGTPLIINKKGIFDTRFPQKFTFDKEFEASKLLRRRNYGGIFLKAGVTLPNLPKNETVLHYLERNERTEADRMTRKCYEIFKIVTEFLNFKFDFVETGGWGLFKNGTWTGTMGYIQREEIHFSVTPLRHDSRRIHWSHYLPDIYATRYFDQLAIFALLLRLNCLSGDRIFFIFRHPKVSSLRNQFFEPFNPDVWWSVLAVSIVITLIMKAAGRVEKYKDMLFDSSLSNLALTNFGVLFLQGTSNNFNLRSSRAIFLAMLIFAFFINQFYSAFVVGSLLMAQPRTITTMEALYDSGLRLGMEDIAYNYEFFQKFPVPLARKMFTEKMITDKSKNIVTLDRGLEMIKTGGFAFHVDSSGVYVILTDLLNEEEVCELQEVAFLPLLTSSGVIPNDSPFIEHFNNVIERTRESGMLDRFTKIWQPGQPECIYGNGPNSITAVELMNFLPSIIMLVYGMLISLLFFIGEIFFNKYKLKF